MSTNDKDAKRSVEALMARGKAQAAVRPKEAPSTELKDALENLRRVELDAGPPAPEPIEVQPEGRGEVMVNDVEAAAAYVPPITVEPGEVPPLPSGPVRIRSETNGEGAPPPGSAITASKPAANGPSLWLLLAGVVAVLVLVVALARVASRPPAAIEPGSGSALVVVPSGSASEGSIASAPPGPVTSAPAAPSAAAAASMSAQPDAAPRPSKELQGALTASSSSASAPAPPTAKASAAPAASAEATAPPSAAPVVTAAPTVAPAVTSAPSSKPAASEAPATSVKVVPPPWIEKE